MKEPRYIDANKIKLTGITFSDVNNEVYFSLSDVRKAIEQTPTEDVVEVRHAYWKETTHITESKRRREIHSKLYNCSYCDAPNGRKKSNYCHWCGAKMDGERKEQE